MDVSQPIWLPGRLKKVILFALDFLFLKEDWKKAYLIQIRTRSKNKMEYFW